MCMVDPIGGEKCILSVDKSVYFCNKMCMFGPISAEKCIFCGKGCSKMCMFDIIGG